ncbi:MAG: RNA polymerase sigma factor [Flavobacteriales bacterium]|nr:RNA polymerase sigma factor [Flavobacteriales bacterium]
MQLSDGEIVEQVKSGQNTNIAFRALIEKYQERLYWHVRRMIIDHDDTDDVLQNVFIKAWKGLANFREDSNLYTWLYRIATNESITFINKKKKENNISIDDESYHLHAGQADYLMDCDAIQEKLEKALLTLPEKQRAVFHMKYYEDMKYTQISEIVGTSVGALKASYHIAVKKIENYLIKN